MKPAGLMLLFVLFLLSVKGSAQNTATIASGNWSDGTRWSNGVAGNGTATVNHTMTINQNLSATGDWTINAPVTDPQGGSDYDLTVSGNMDMNANVQIGGTFSMSFLSFATATIRSGDTLTIGYPGSTGTSSIGAGCALTIEAGGVLIVYGDLSVDPAATIQCDGQILIDGDYIGQSFFFNSSITGSGTINTTGGIITSGGSTVFGSTGNCSTGPCSGGYLCGINNSITASQTVCAGVTPATLTGTALTGATCQWQQSTTSAISGFTDIPGSTGASLAFTSAPGTTTWYRRVAKVTSTGCISPSAAVKITVNPSVTASVSISSSVTTVCSGNSITFTATPVNGGSSPAYQWKRNGANVTGANSATYTTTTLANGDIIACELTSNASCVSGSPATSNAITVNIVSGGGSWSGNTSTNWNTLSNWCTSILPVISTNVTINGGTLYSPVISSASAVSNNLTLNAGAILTVSGNALTVYGNLTINNGASLVINSNTVSIAGSITVNTGGQLTVNSPGGLSARGNIINNGTISGTGILTLNGTTAQTLSGSGTYGNVTLNNTLGCTAASVVTVNGVLTIQSGKFTSNGNLIMDLTTGSISPAGNGTSNTSIAGNVTFRKTVVSGRYHYLSSPVLSATATDLNDDQTIKFSYPYYNFYYYDETIADPDNLVGWTPVTSLTTALTPMKGYALFLDGARDIDIVGPYTPATSFTSLSLTNRVSSLTSSDGWNLVGNPYPSTLNWDAASGWTKTGIDNAIYYWDPANDRYASYVAGIGTNGATKYIPSMQAFFVHVAAGGSTVNFNMTNAVRVTNTQSFWKLAADNSLLKLNVEGNGTADETIIRFREDATDTFDTQIDAYKLMNDGNTPSLYTVSGKDEYSINSISESSSDITIPLHFKVTASGTYTLSAADITALEGKYDVYLEDLLLQETQDLRSAPSYSFEGSTSDTTGRFLIHLRVSATTATDQPQNPASVNVYSNRHTIHMNFTGISADHAAISILNTSGQRIGEVHDADISSGSYEIEVPGSHGIYLVRMIVGNTLITKKVVLE